jgi:NAD(P)-dependent dehydrogenase (short-subunit alcohol dehydrogenase family)
MRGLKDKVVIVAGAAPGNIGGATAIRLAEEGAVVVAADLNQAAAQAVVDTITAAGGRASARRLDITDEESFKDLVDFAVSEYGGLHGLFNVAADLSAATIGADSDVTTVSIDVWKHTIDVTLTGYMYGIRHALPVMIAGGGGSIVNTMSSSVWEGEDIHAAYQSAKSGLVGLTRHAASVGGKRGVRTNAVAPGVVLTGTALAVTSQEWRDEALAAVRSPRLGVPEDLGAFVAFLMSDDAAYINGQTMLMDGGANFQ